MAIAFARAESGKPIGAVGAEVLPVAFPPRTALRKRMALLFGGLLCAAAAAYQAYQAIQPVVVFTDNAYAVATLAQVTAQIDGTIAGVWVHDTQYVRRGQLLVTLDREDAELDYQSALAAYEGAVRAAEREIARTRAADADVHIKAALVEQAQLKLQRRSGAAGVVAAEEISTARNAVRTARYALAIAQNEAAAAGVMVKGLDSGGVPGVKTARIALMRAALRLRRTELRAPIDGVVAQVRAQAGQQITPGLILMSIVPIHQLYVEANFKESQLAAISVGQRATVTSDLYGSNKIFHGTVEGIGGGTGAVFSILPAQNATGNWIKVVQRVPVRIALDAEDLKQAPLRAGLSMSATIELTKPLDAGAPRHSAPFLRAVARAEY